MPRSTATSAAPYVPPLPTLASMRAAVQRCRGCELYKHATQAVFGDGQMRAPLVLVGEQPCDKEDLAGHPFVGPAGALLDSALEEAGIARADAYVTNAVKHFKFVERGKRRIHAKPKVTEIRACHPWLEAELSVVQPRLVVALGATAALALFGPAFRVTQQRGTVFRTAGAPAMLATVHPSSILRAADDETRRQEMRAFVGDLRVAAEALSAP